MTVVSAPTRGNRVSKFNVGDRVQVMRGPFVGARGQLVRVAAGRHKLVIAVEFVNQAVAVEIDAHDVDHCD